jgi:NAD+ kinase
MKVAIYGRNFKDEFIPYFETLIRELEANNIEFQINGDFHTFLLEKNIACIKNANVYRKRDEIKRPIDFLFSIGGDGTILGTVTSINDTGTPIIGVNSGRLGFLANTSKDEIKQAIKYLVEGNYRIEQRSLLELNSKSNLFGKFNFALNELTVHKKDSASMMTVHAYVDDLYLNSYWVDGLIVSTPTGSTAYSLSCGGPILAPMSKNMVITPIAPHNLNIRPMVISDNSTIRLKVEGREDTFLATLDSRSEEITAENELVISKAKFTINLVQFPNQDFFSTIRNKLFWGRDKRN